MNSTHGGAHGATGGFGGMPKDGEIHESRTSVGLAGQYKTSQSFFPSDQGGANVGNQQRKSHEVNGHVAGK